jgi:CBS domain-containing protein
MTTRVVAVRENATFKDMAALLTENRVSAFPVLDEEERSSESYPRPIFCPRKPWSRPWDRRSRGSGASGFALSR